MLVIAHINLHVTALRFTFEKLVEDLKFNTTNMF